MLFKVLFNDRVRFPRDADREFSMESGGITAPAVLLSASAGLDSGEAD